MRKSTIVFLELGMLGGIAVAGYMLPDRTPLWTFLAASGACFLLGNVLLVQRLRQGESKNSVVQGGPWPHVVKALAILAVAWLLILVLFRR
jgi:hypothetical protein